MFPFGDMFIAKVDQEITRALDFDGKMDKIEYKRERDMIRDPVLFKRKV
jgi:hypothetical protein